MYVNPFVAGVLATILAEVVIVIGIGIYTTFKKNGGKK